MQIISKLKESSFQNCTVRFHSLYVSRCCTPLKRVTIFLHILLQRREETMMARIREAECDQMIGELKQKMAAMEIQKEEVLAADRLESKGGSQELANTIFDLQEEVTDDTQNKVTVLASVLISEKPKCDMSRVHVTLTPRSNTCTVFYCKCIYS